MATWHGFMLFMSEAPMIGIDPQPCGAPEPLDPLPTDGAVWATQVYYGEPTKGPLLISAAQDVEARQEHLDHTDEEDDEEEPDVVLQVAVDDDGTLHVFDGDDQEPFRTFTARQVFKAYGVPFPETTP